MGYDAAVIGAGHNGLAAALRLARAGRRVVVLEAREAPGGLCAGEEFHPGYRTVGVLHDSSTLSPEVAEGLDLAAHGLRFADPEPLYAPEEDGPGLLLPGDPGEPAAELAARSPADAAAYRAWRDFLARVRPLVRRLLHEAPPPLGGLSSGDLWRLGMRGLALRRLGRRDMTELLRVLPMCAGDWLKERFATPLLQGLLAAPAVAGTWSGPWSAGTAANLLLHESLAGRPVAGGPAALVAALVAACRAAGVEVRTAAGVRRIRLAGGRVAGLVLASGEAVEAPLVAASCDPKQTFLRLLPPGGAPVKVEEAFRTFRARGTAAKVHLALAGPLELRGREGQGIGALRLGGGDLDALERAFDAVKYRRLSPAPLLDVRVPSLADPDLAPPGHHVVSILVSFAPYDLVGGWSDERRQALGEAVVAALGRHAPGVGERLVAREVLAPPDLEARYGTTGGHLHHGEHALDQLFALRPAPCAARYATPVPGLFLAGSGSHPGGGVTALPGWLAAGAMLRPAAARSRRRG
jgi:phytoene dehydrogenase-like protein